MPSSAQLHAARALVGMSRADLAKAAQVRKSKIKLLESTAAVPKEEVCRALETALEAAGVVFIKDGVRLRGNM